MIDLISEYDLIADSLLAVCEEDDVKQLERYLLAELPTIQGDYNGILNSNVDIPNQYVDIDFIDAFCKKYNLPNCPRMAEPEITDEDSYEVVCEWCGETPNPDYNEDEDSSQRWELLDRAYSLAICDWEESVKKWLIKIGEILKSNSIIEQIEEHFDSEHMRKLTEEAMKIIEENSPIDWTHLNYLNRHYADKRYDKRTASPYDTFKATASLWGGTETENTVTAIIIAKRLGYADSVPTRAWKTYEAVTDVTIE